MDLLRMDFINSLQQPIMCTELDGTQWPLYDLDVETGLMRIDVCGKLQVTEVSEFQYFLFLRKYFVPISASIFKFFRCAPPSLLFMLSRASQVSNSPHFQHPSSSFFLQQFLISQ